MLRRPPRSTGPDTLFPNATLCRSPGALLLAGERVDLSVLASQHQALRRMAAALGDGAQVLLYGCSIASGPAGRRFLEYRSEEPTSELQSLMRISYAVFCLKKNNSSD